MNKKFSFCETIPFQQNMNTPQIKTYPKIPMQQMQQQSQTPSVKK